MLIFLKCLMVIFLLAVGLFCSGSVVLGAESENIKSENNISWLSIDIGLKTGYRLDQLDWNIAGNNAGTDPNILSELKWEDLEIWQVQAGSIAVAGNRQQDGYLYYLRWMLGWGSIFNGDNQDSDYAGDNRTLEFSRSNNSADNGSVFDFSVGAGLEFGEKNEKWRITPLVGFSYHEQNVGMTDGFQTVSDQAIANNFFDPDRTMPPLGAFEERLDSSYHAEWYGPWLGVELMFRPVGQWLLSGCLEYHWADYYGEANWNLRSDLAHPVSFRHWADGNGMVLGAGVKRNFKKSWSFDLSTNYQNWQTDTGTDIVYLSDGTRGGTRLNEVNWKSFSVMAGLTRRF